MGKLIAVGLGVLSLDGTEPEIHPWVIYRPNCNVYVCKYTIAT